MKSRRTLTAVLALTQLTTVLATGVFSWSGNGADFGINTASAEGFAGEDLGLDLYRKVDKGIGSLKTMMAEKRLPGNAAKLNARIGKACSDKSGAKVECLDPSKDFTLAELNDIEAGSVAPISARFAANVSVNADDLQKISKNAKEYATAVKKESGEQTEAFARIGSMGIFTDGSLDNSSYDLMKDLENVHAVIFAKDVPYGGMPTDGAQSVVSFAQASGYPSSSAGLSAGYYVGSTINPPAYLGSFSGHLTSPDLESKAGCADGTSVKGLDTALAFDIENQLAYGSNAGTAGTPEDLAKYAGNSPVAPVARPSSGGGRENKMDKFPCMTFFCIRVDFIMYDTMLLGGGKTYSIESVLDENYKIVQKFAGTSFIQAQHTNNFFELLLKNLNLSSLVHLGVVVQTLPPPILNLNAAETPRGASKTSSEEKEFKEITSKTFQAYGIRYDKQNVIDDNQTQHAIRNLEDLNTEQAADGKTASTPVPEGNYVLAKEAGIRQGYSDSFGNDLQELRGFTQTFTDSILNVGSLSQKFSEIPKGK